MRSSASRTRSRPAEGWSPGSVRPNDGGIHHGPRGSAASAGSGFLSLPRQRRLACRRSHGSRGAQQRPVPPSRLRMIHPNLDVGWRSCARLTSKTPSVKRSTPHYITILTARRRARAGRAEPVDGLCLRVLTHVRPETLARKTFSLRLCSFISWFYQSIGIAFGQMTCIDHRAQQAAVNSDDRLACAENARAGTYTRVDDLFDACTHHNH